MLSQNIITLRKNKKISQEQLAEVLQTSRQAVSKWERGESYPDIEKIKELATYFNVSIDYLLDFDIESLTVKSFIKRERTCIEQRDFSIDLKDIKVMIAQNSVNFALLINTIEYLLLLNFEKRDKDITQLTVDYAKRAILFYQENNPFNLSENDLKKSIVTSYIINNQFLEAKNYLVDNYVYDEETTKAICEFELGGYDEAFKIASNQFLKSVTSLFECNLIQCRVLLKNNKIKEAYQLSCFMLDFIKKIEKQEGLFTGLIFLTTFIKACCERYLGLSVDESVKLLKDYRDKSNKTIISTDKINFYYLEKSDIYILLDDYQALLEKEKNMVLKNTLIYKDFLAIYDEVFGGES